LNYLSTDDPRSPAVERKIDEQMRRDPRASPLTIDCASHLLKVGLRASPASRYRDVPRRAASHRIVPSDAAGAGEFVAAVALGGNGKWVRYEVAEVGTLDITEFDGATLKATFSFGARRTGDAATVTITGGVFAPCDGEACAPP